MSTQPPPDVVPPSAAVRAGVARRDITPPVGIYNRNWGAAKHDVAEGVHRPLSATVLAISSSDGGEPLILASIDAGWWQGNVEELRIRRAVLEAAGVDEARCILCLTHTHASCSLSAEDAGKPGGHLIEPYLRHLVTSLSEAAREAIARLEPAILTWGTGRCDLATNRDLPDSEKPRVVCGYNPSRSADETLLVGRIVRAKDAADACTPSRPTAPPIATLVNYACHPTTLAWENRLLSPDFVGATREVIERDTGDAPCLFLQGASGELSPREQYVGDTAIADANGKRLGYAALAILENMLPAGAALAYAGVVESGAPLATWRRRPMSLAGQIAARRIDVPLPLKPGLPSAAQIEQELNACTDRTMAERLRRKLRIAKIIGDGPACDMPAWIWRVGDTLIVGQPNEAYSDFQIALRAAFPHYAVVVMNLVNGCVGYVSPPELYDLDIYQVWQSPFDRGSLPLLIERCRDVMGELIA